MQIHHLISPHFVLFLQFHFIPFSYLLPFHWWSISHIPLFVSRSAADSVLQLIWFCSYNFFISSGTSVKLIIKSCMQGIEEKSIFEDQPCSRYLWINIKNIRKWKVKVPKVNEKIYFRKQFENISLYGMYNHMSP